jgi:phenylalanyl-tRNA synthetase alpha chain
MLDKISEIRQKVLEELEKSLSPEELQELKVKIMGKKGYLTALYKDMRELSEDFRREAGQVINELRLHLEEVLEGKEKEVAEAILARRLQDETLDISLPGLPVRSGWRHPLTMVIDEMEEILMSMGFSVVEGPEIETDYYNFQALNFPKDHPARDMQDSFFVSEEIVLRSQTSSVQVRAMEKICPVLPVKIIAPGKVFRDDDDATHSPMFHQVEGLYVDEGVRMSDLKGVLLAFVRQLFGRSREIRLRPSFFPFTEPSAEVDISCMFCACKGCRLCKGTGWIEILGAGMVHPKVLEMGGYDPAKVTGFAFGVGVERVAMLKYGIEDMRWLFDNDIRFLRQF